MSKKLKTLLVVSLAAIPLLTACSASPQMGRTFGWAVRDNQTVQQYNPNAATGVEKAIMLDGQKAEQVVNSYRKERGDVESGKLLKDLGG